MKRRMLALIGVLTLCLSLLTVNAAAAEEEAPFQGVIVGGVELDSSNGTVYARTDSADAVTTEGAGETDWNIKLEGDVLTLNGAAITQGYTHEGSCAGIYSEHDLEIVLVGENTIGGDGMDEGVHVLDSLVLSGDGSLDVAVSGDSYCCGICADDWLTMSGGTVKVSAAAESGDCYGVYMGDSVELIGGSLQTTAASQAGDSVGIYCDLNLFITGNATGLTASGGTSAASGDFYVNGYIYDVDTNKAVQVAGGQVTADGQSREKAAANEVWVDGVQIYGGAVPGSVEGASYDPATNTLTLEGAYITKAYAYQSDLYTAGIYSPGNLNVKLMGSNTIAGDNDMSDGICVMGNLTIDGPGSLDISLASDIDYMEAIYGGYLYINGCTLDITCSGVSANVFGLISQYDLTIDDTTVNIDNAASEGRGIAVNSGHDLIVTDSTINVSMNAPHYSSGVSVYHNAAISGGTITASAVSTENGQCDGLAAWNELTIYGCTVRAFGATASETLDGSGLYCGGRLDVSGGDIVAEGSDFGVLLEFPDGKNVFSVDGGKLTAVSEERGAVGVYGTALELCIGPEGTLALDAPTLIACAEESSDLTYTMTNQGTLQASVQDAEQAQKLLDGGGTVTLELGGDLEGDLSVPAGTVLTVDGGGQYAVRGTVTCLTAADQATALTLKNLTLDGAGEAERAVCCAGGLALTMEGCTVSGYTGRAVDLGAGSSFNGVSEQDWYYDAMCCAWGNGLLDYTNDGQNAPASPISRAALVTALWRMAGQPVVNFAMDFDDVAGDAWYAEAVRWAASEKLLETSTGTFDPETSVTREETAVLLYRYAQVRGDDVSIGEDTNILSYTDAFDVSEGAMSAMQWACGAGIIQGAGDGSLLNPLADTTCAEAAAMLMRLGR